jgi:hypothetical protein
MFQGSSRAGMRRALSFACLKHRTLSALPRLLLSACLCMRAVRACLICLEFALPSSCNFAVNEGIKPTSAWLRARSQHPASRARCTNSECRSHPFVPSCDLLWLSVGYHLLWHYAKERHCYCILLGCSGSMEGHEPQLAPVLLPHGSLGVNHVNAPHSS